MLGPTPYRWHVNLRWEAVVFSDGLSWAIFLIVFENN